MRPSIPNRSRGRRLAAAFVLSLLAACGPGSPQAARKPPPAEAEAYPDLLARLPDGRNLNFRCAGAGKFTVILESGYGAGSLAWPRVQPELAKRYRVCAYDRAGYGFSDPGPEPRDGTAIVRDLDRGLKAARIKGPYILVGHSAGGLYARLFASRRPKDVAGLVLVDTSVEHQEARFAEFLGTRTSGTAGIRARAQRCLEAAEQKALPSTDPKLAACSPTPNEKLPASVNAARLAQAQRPGYWGAQVSELDNLWTRTSDEIDAAPPTYGDMPLIVLTAGEAYAELPEAARGVVRELWAALHREVAARSTEGQARVVAGSGHLMMRDRPDAIIAAVDEVAREVHSG